jgi:hypothetical protein
VRLSGGSSTPAPTVLHLGNASGGAQTLATAAIASDQSSPAAQPGEAYTLTGALPEGKPPDAPVYGLQKATADDAMTVARALHLDGMPTRADGGWVVRDGINRLAVRDDGTWSYGPDCFGGPEAQEELTVECASASASSSNTNDPAGPDEATAKATAYDVMRALGYEDVDVAVNPGDPSAYVEATPQIDGQPAYGWTVGLAVDAAGSVDNGNGWVGSPQRGASYPLITASEAFALLQQQPRPMTDMCMVREDGKPGCAPIPPTEVTGASLGLAMDYESEQPILVPSWLFTVKDQIMPVSQIGVDPKYIATPSP